MKNIYKNELIADNSADVTDEEFKILEMINHKSKSLLIDQASEKIAYYIMLWFKYYRLENTTYDNLARTGLQNNIILLADIQAAIEKSKQILTGKYQIKIESLNSLILYSEIPFRELNEKL